MIMQYLVPATLRDALEAAGTAGIQFIAGGTDLCVQMEEHLITPEKIIDIAGLEELDFIREDTTGLRIGAAVKIAEIAASRLLPVCLRDGARAIGSPQIRNLGTIGGNICNASPCGDTLVSLVVLKAEFLLVSLGGERKVAAEDFFTGPKATVLAPGEILKEICIPENMLEGASAFGMIGKRNGQVISQANTAVRLVCRNGVIAEAGIAAGSVAPVPLRLPKTEQYITGKKPEEITRRGIGTSVEDEIVPIDDVRASKEYRYSVTGTLVYDAVMKALTEEPEKNE